MIVTALKNFEHGRSYKRGDTLNVSSATAAELRKKGLVSVNGLGEDTPPSAGGAELSSVSPAAHRSPRATAKPSGDGAKPAKKKEAKKAGK